MSVLLATALLFADPPDAQWVVESSSGVEAELLGIKREVGDWWRPDGTPAADLPKVRAEFSNEVDDRVVYILIGGDQLVEEDFISLEVDGSRCSKLPATRGASGVPEGMLLFAGSVGDGPPPPSATVRVRLAAGPWQTIAEATGRRLAAKTRSKDAGRRLRATLQRGIKYDGQPAAFAAVSLAPDEGVEASDRLQNDYRVVAVDRTGRPADSHSFSRGGSDPMPVFFGVAKGKADGFVLQTRAVEELPIEGVQLRPNPAVGGNPAWPIDVADHSGPPPIQWIDRDAPVRSLTFESIEFEGRPTDVFAFHATPGSVSGDASKDVDLPGVVLLHGGGGTAFAAWAEMWALRGYAAIAVDLSGRRPADPTFDPQTRRVTTPYNNAPKATRLPRGGPDHTHAEKFAAVGDDRSDDWQPHAVAAAVRAHSLLRSFPEVDADRTAVTGISWGGYLTCLVASVDDRFKAAVPVYGCGFLHEGESVQKPSIDALSTAQRTQWVAEYDPSALLPQCRVPVLFVNGTTDKHYPLDSYAKTVSLVAPSLRTVRIEPGMRHSHRHGWEPEEIGLFIDQHCRDGVPLPKLTGVTSEAGVARATVEAKTPIASAALHYTTDAGLLRDRTWKRRPAVIAHGEATARIPNDATVWLLSATDDRGAFISSNAVVE